MTAPNTIRFPINRNRLTFKVISCLMTGLLLAGSTFSYAEPAKAKKANNSTPTSSKAATTKAKAAKQSSLDEETRKTLEAAALKLDPETQQSLNRLAEALRQQDRAVYNDLRDEEELSLSNIGMLWQAAVERSGTIRYAIEKLSRRDSTGKPVDNDHFTKRVVSSLVHLGGVAGTMWTGTPAGLIGSNMVQDLMSGNPQDSALSRVTDADMVILAKDVEKLQSDLIQHYYNYQHAKERLALAKEASSTVAKYYDQASNMKGNNVDSLQPLIETMYDAIRQDELTAQQAYNSSRNSLALLVGPEAIAALEQPGKKANN